MENNYNVLAEKFTADWKKYLNENVSESETRHERQLNELKMNFEKQNVNYYFYNLNQLFSLYSKSFFVVTLTSNDVN
jgi:hypothetical protein